MVQKNHWVAVIEGESGYGKTFSYRYINQKFQNVFYVEMTSTDRQSYTSIWKRLALKVLGDEVYNKNCRDVSLATLTDYIVFGLNSKENNICILDEGGALSMASLRYFRSLADRTKFSTGYILSGPGYFVKRLNTFIKDQIDGAAELETRIDLIVTLQAPSTKEKQFICSKEGIEKAETVSAIIKKAQNFRSLFREIEFHKVGIQSRYVSEWN